MEPAGFKIARGFMIDSSILATNAIPVNVRANPLKENSVIASVPRNTISMDAVLNEAATLTTGLDKYQISHAAEILKNIFTRLLKTGNAVSVLDMGTLYLVPTGAVDSTNPSTSDIQGFTARFSTAAKFQKELDGLTAANIQITETNPVITAVVNTHTKEADGTLAATFSARLTGRKLKLGGEVCGLWFAKVTTDADGNETLTDESEWIQVPGDYITRNMPSEISFDLPRTLEEGATYKIILRTSISGGNVLKNWVQSVSPAVTVVAA